MISDKDLDSIYKKGKELALEFGEVKEIPQDPLMGDPNLHRGEYTFNHLGIFNTSCAYVLSQEDISIKCKIGTHTDDRGVPKEEKSYLLINLNGEPICVFESKKDKSEDGEFREKVYIDKWGEFNLNKLKRIINQLYKKIPDFKRGMVFSH